MKPVVHLLLFTDGRIIDVFNESQVDADYCEQHNNMLNMTEIKNPH